MRICKNRCLTYLGIHDLQTLGFYKLIFEARGSIFLITHLLYTVSFTDLHDMQYELTGVAKRPIRKFLPRTYSIVSTMHCVHYKYRIFYTLVGLPDLYIQYITL